jgi:hypothetical protein
MRRCGLVLLGGLTVAGCGGDGGGGGPPTITSVVIDGDSTVVLADRRQLTATAKSGATTVTGVTFQWSSSDTTRATVTAGGLVNGIRLGNTTITAQAVVDGTPTGVFSAPHAIRTRIRSITITPSSAPQFASLGDSLSITAEARDGDDAPVAGITFAWQSLAPGVVSATARVNTTQADVVAIGNGASPIVVTGDGVSDTIVVAVDQIPKTVLITPANFGTPDVTMQTNQTAPFYAVVLDSLDQPALQDTVVWSTDNPGVANVGGGISLDSTVITTFAGAGTATITATASPASASRVVIVSDTPISFATEVLTIFTGAADCDGCHPPSGSLNLTAGAAYTSVVGVNASQVGALKRVRPFRPDSSYLVHKIQGTQSSVSGFGARMPLGCAGATCLSNAVINTIRNWILQGALNN